MLRTNCITSERSAGEGLRISVMSRHTMSDGVTPNPEIRDDLWDAWWPELAPPDKLMGDYYKRNLPWEMFAERYIEFTHAPVVETSIEELAEMALQNSVTLLCIEETAEQCHRRLLAERCQELIPILSVDIH